MILSTSITHKYKPHNFSEIVLLDITSNVSNTAPYMSLSAYWLSSITHHLPRLYYIMSYIIINSFLHIDIKPGQNRTDNYTRCGAVIVTSKYRSKSIAQKDLPVVVLITMAANAMREFH